jgi:uroporphyrinogen III methyltransferase/synthase
MNEQRGKVTLVGAGPGDPSLITVRGAQALQSADVVLYDYLASPQLLIGTRPDAELVCLGRHGQGRLLTQQEINARMIAAANAGQYVVRLKGGDPAVFARLTEELAALEAAGVNYEIVPGITTATAVASYAGIPLTDRDAASSVTLVTGQERAGKADGAELDFAALAATPGTLVFYMGVTTAPVWSQALIAAGKPADTPVAIVRRCSFPDQETFVGTLGDIPQLLAPGRIRPPAIVIVGEVARHAGKRNWFTERPLFGRTVLVTRPRHQAKPMCERLARLGARVLVQPAVEIGPIDNLAQLDAAIANLDKFDWLVFSSSNGVGYFLDRLKNTGRDMRALGNLRIAAIGPGTVDALAAYSLRADVCPDEYRAEALAEALATDAGGKRFLLVRASRGREVLAEMLTTAGGQIEQVVAYTSRDVGSADPEVAHALVDGDVDWTTVTSSAIARSLVKLFGEQLKRTKLAAISPLTAGVLSKLGYEPAIVGQVYTADGLVDAILATESQ